MIHITTLPYNTDESPSPPLLPPLSFSCHLANQFTINELFNLQSSPTVSSPQSTLGSDSPKTNHSPPISSNATLSSYHPKQSYDPLDSNLNIFIPSLEAPTFQTVPTPTTTAALSDEPVFPFVIPKLSSPFNPAQYEVDEEQCMDETIIQHFFDMSILENENDEDDDNHHDDSFFKNKTQSFTIKPATADIDYPLQPIENDFINMSPYLPSSTSFTTINTTKKTTNIWKTNFFPFTVTPTSYNGQHYDDPLNDDEFDPTFSYNHSDDINYNINDNNENNNNNNDNDNNSNNNINDNNNNNDNNNIPNLSTSYTSASGMFYFPPSHASQHTSTTTTNTITTTTIAPYYYTEEDFFFNDTSSPLPSPSSTSLLPLAMDILIDLFPEYTKNNIQTMLSSVNFDMDRALELFIPRSATIIKKRQVCRHYLQGDCHRQDCRFAHHSNMNLKVKVCKFWLQEDCLKGDDCEFLHDIDAQWIQEIKKQTEIKQATMKEREENKKLKYNDMDSPKKNKWKKYRKKKSNKDSTTIMSHFDKVTPIDSQLQSLRHNSTLDKQHQDEFPALSSSTTNTMSSPPSISSQLCSMKISSANNKNFAQVVASKI
ncbi:hypothetical protein BJ944DRAFT_244511 [Cunninghamella echinulata]|nr:hypothetical protein BJ944DRAFT_244511 [Cunninghamella echinulata]